MNNKRDKFLTEAMGECWHKGIHPLYKSQCSKCGKLFTSSHQVSHTNFSTPDGFFKLWNWAQEQAWWFHFGRSTLETYQELPISITRTYVQNLIHPDRFANTTYEFLKEREDGKDTPSIARRPAAIDFFTNEGCMTLWLKIQEMDWFRFNQKTLKNGFLESLPNNHYNWCVPIKIIRPDHLAPAVYEFLTC